MVFLSQIGARIDVRACERVVPERYPFKLPQRLKMQATRG